MSADFPIAEQKWDVRYHEKIWHWLPNRLSKPYHIEPLLSPFRNHELDMAVAGPFHKGADFRAACQ